MLISKGIIAIAFIFKRLVITTLISKIIVGFNIHNLNLNFILVVLIKTHMLKIQFIISLIKITIK